MEKVVICTRCEGHGQDPSSPGAPGRRPDGACRRCEGSGMLLKKTTFAPFKPKDNPE